MSGIVTATFYNEVCESDGDNTDSLFSWNDFGGDVDDHISTGKQFANPWELHDCAN